MTVDDNDAYHPHGFTRVRISGRAQTTGDIYRLADNGPCGQAAVPISSNPGSS